MLVQVVACAFAMVDASLSGLRYMASMEPPDPVAAICLQTSREAKLLVLSFVPQLVEPIINDCGKCIECDELRSINSDEGRVGVLPGLVMHSMNRMINGARHCHCQSLLE
jgi:hypothetical protein